MFTVQEDGGPMRIDQEPVHSPLARNVSGLFIPSHHVLTTCLEIAQIWGEIKKVRR